jgi:hypothetical protein
VCLGRREQHLRKHPDDFDDQDLDRYADRDDKGLEELGTPV